MPTDLTTAEKAAALGLTKCGCGLCSLWYDNPEGVYNNHEVDALYAERLPTLTLQGPTGWSVASTSPTPDYRAALEGLVSAIDRGDGDAYRVALTHARKVLHV